MIDIRTLLFANAVVSVVLGIAMVLVWRGNRERKGLAVLARVHVTMIPGVALIGLPDGLIPSVVSAFFGNGLVLLSMLWLLQGIDGLFDRPSRRWPVNAVAAWGLGQLILLTAVPSLRGRILLTSFVAFLLLFGAARTAGAGLRRPTERMASLLITGSLGVLSVLFAARCLSLALSPGTVTPLSSDGATLVLLTVCLAAATGWSMGVMILVYARLHQDLARDMTERKRYEAALEELVQVAAHELRSPLTSIFGTLQLLAARGDALPVADKNRLLEIARRNSERMVRLVNDLLDLERVESGRASFEIEPVDLRQHIGQARDLAESAAHHRRVSIEISTLPPLQVRADPQRLQQVLANLLSNAVKFSPPGEAIRLRAHHHDGKVRVEVQDRGPGISPDLQGRLFQRFARGETPGLSDEQGKGTGLGLAISKALVEGMGGWIGYEPGRPRGTTFYFELPAAGA